MTKEKPEEQKNNTLWFGLCNSAELLETQKAVHHTWKGDSLKSFNSLKGEEMHILRDSVNTAIQTHEQMNKISINVCVVLQRQNHWETALHSPFSLPTPHTVMLVQEPNGLALNVSRKPQPPTGINS